jgi:hypothetical protein
VQREPARALLSTLTRQFARIGTVKRLTDVLPPPKLPVADSDW